MRLGEPIKFLLLIAIAGDPMFLRLLSDFNAKLSRQEAEVRSSVYKITEKDFFTELLRIVCFNLPHVGAVWAAHRCAPQILKARTRAMLAITLFWKYWKIKNVTIPHNLDVYGGVKVILIAWKYATRISSWIPKVFWKYLPKIQSFMAIWAN